MISTSKSCEGITLSHADSTLYNEQIHQLESDMKNKEIFESLSGELVPEIIVDLEVLECVPVAYLTN